MIRLARLLRDRRGTSVVELAFIMPALAATAVGVVDLSRGYSAKLELDQAAYRAIEKVQQYYTTQSTYDTLQTEAATAAGVPTGNVTIDYWLECNGVRQSTANTTCGTGQTYARWVTVDVQSNYTPIFNLAMIGGSSGSITLHGKAGLRTQ